MAGMFSAPSADARLFGEVELGYNSYDARFKDTAPAADWQKLDSNSFTQRYLLLYETGGNLLKGQLGSYNLALGYEWGALNTTINSNGAEQNLDVNSGHLLYRGDLNIAPKGVPLRLTLFSRDITPMRFTPDDSANIGTGDNIIDPGILTSLENGSHVTTGARLLLGTNNTTAKIYRNSIFELFPMIMVDYRDDYVVDLKSLIHENNRTKTLAFVTLNKKDNWFHFRSIRYDDYVTPSSSFKEDQFILGTVDQALNRKWVDLTNWIKISVDGQFTKRAESDRGNKQMYDLNLYAVAAREKWEARTYNNFSRTLDYQGLTYESKTPFYFNGIWGNDTDWQSRISSETKKLLQVNGPDVINNSLLASARVNTFKRSSFTLSPYFSVERAEQDAVRTLALEGGVETASTRKFSDTYGLFASYNVKTFAQDGGSATANTVQQILTGRGIYKYSPALRFELEEKITVASGNNSKVVTTNISPTQDFASTSSSSGLHPREEATSSYTRYVTTLTTSWTPLARLRVGFTASADVYQQEGQPLDTITALTNTIDYNLPNFIVGSNVRYAKRTAGDLESTEVTANGRMRYSPSRNIQAELSYTYSTIDEGNQVSTNLDLSQRFKYSIATRMGGRGRNMLELSEELSYVKAENTQYYIGRHDSKKRLTLGAKYYPTKSLYLHATGRYSLLEPGKENEWLGNAGIGLNYKKFQATLDYSYGTREGLGNRIERRLSANVRKQF